MPKDLAPPVARPRLDMGRGTVKAVNYAKGPAAADGVATMLFTFDVEFDAGQFSGIHGVSLQKDVILLMPSFQALSRANPAPTGLVVSPEVGSRVLCMHDGVRWVILGCLTGPVITGAERAEDTEGLRGSYNPGIESAIARTDTAMLGEIPGWTYGYEPGDIVAGKGDSRLKVTALGVVTGAGPACMTWHKADGEKLERYVEKTVRSPGHHSYHSTNLGSVNLLLSRNPSFGPMPVPTMAYTYHVDIVEASPWSEMLQPYVIRQRGHISQQSLGDGRHAVVEQLWGLQAATENLTKSYTMTRDAVIQPLNPVIATINYGELDKDSYTCYDRQVDPDGSFRIRAGNRAKTPGAAYKAVPTNDFAAEYDATTGAFHLRMGTGPAAMLEITANGLTGAVSIRGTKIDVTAAEYNVLAPKISFTGTVALNGSFTATGLVTLPGSTAIGGVPFVAHTHSGVQNGGGVTGPAVVSPT